MTLASPTICGATWVAFCGSPSVSNCLIVTAQFGLALVCSSIATFAPYRMFRPRAASARSGRRPSRWRCRPDRSHRRYRPRSRGCRRWPRRTSVAVLVDLAARADRQVAARRRAAGGRRTPEAAASRWPPHSSSSRCLTSIHRPPTSGSQPRPPDDGGSHRSSMHVPPPKILFTGRSPAASTSPTRGEPIPRMAQDTAYACPRNQNATRGSPETPK